MFYAIPYDTFFHFSCASPRSPPLFIWIEGASYPVTCNGHSALRRLQKVKNTELFWIDSICIDQTAGSEKAEQLKFMADTYKNVTRVVVWLGTAEDANVAMDFVHKLWLQGSIPGAAISARTDEQWHALFVLLHHPWFERIRVIQEVVLGRKVVIVYGTVAIPWEHLSQVIELVGNPFLVNSSVFSSLEKTRIRRELPHELVPARFTAMMRNRKGGPSRLATAAVELPWLSRSGPGARLNLFLKTTMLNICFLEQPNSYVDFLA